MIRFLSTLLDKLSSFLAHRKGLLILVGICLVIANLILRFLAISWSTSSDLLLHLGVIIALIGVLLAWAL